VVAAAAASCEQLIFLGKLSPERLAGVYSQCDIGLAAYSHTSNVEMPDKFYDYTAAGLAIINSLRGEVSSKIREHDIGFQYEASDHIDLVDKLRLLVTDPELLARLRENSFRVAMEYDVQHQYAQLVEFIGDAVSCNNTQNFNK
jgi:glycosyltransferase involved in cell wall biosynthesis